MSDDDGDVWMGEADTSWDHWMKSVSPRIEWAVIPPHSYSHDGDDETPTKAEASWPLQMATVLILDQPEHQAEELK